MPIDDFDWPDERPDYHSVYSIHLCELVEAGFDPFGDERWDTLAWYSDEQRSRWEDKFKARYWFRDIGITPPGEWRHELTRLMGEVLPKYKQLYEQLDNGAGPLSTLDEYGKERRVFSDFPATQLNPETEDYARSANDYQYEHMTNGDWIDRTRQVFETYNDVDVLLLDEMEGMFSCLLTVTLPGF